MTHAVYYDYRIEEEESIGNILTSFTAADPMDEIHEANQFLLAVANEHDAGEEVKYAKFSAYWRLSGAELGDYSSFIYYVAPVD